LAVMQFDRQETLVKASDNIIELLICPITSDVCDLSSASVPAINQRFDSLTGLSNIKAAVECVMGHTEMMFWISIVGADYIPEIFGRMRCTQCDTGQRIVVHDSKGTWNCETCGLDTYSANHVSQTESGQCLACPPSAKCINGVPIFGASKVTGEFEIELLEGCDGDYTIREALAVKLGVDASKIILPKHVQQQRAAQNITFELFADTAQMAEISARLSKVGAVLGETEEIRPPLAHGEVWEEEVVGEYAVLRLQSCPYGNYIFSSGSLSVVNTLQKCEPCGKGEECTNLTCTMCSLCTPGYYKTAVSTAPCSACPADSYREDVGATELGNCLDCPFGAYTQIQEGQKSLDTCQCGERLYASTSGNTLVCLNCPAGATCPDLSCSLRTSPFACKIFGEWVRDISSDEFRLLSCPIGYKLDNSTGHDNYACKKCLEGYYVQDSGDPDDSCRKCPSSATCLNGAPPIFQAAIVTGEIELDGLLEEGGEQENVWQALMEALAHLLSVDISRIALPNQNRRVQRRGQKKVFEIVGEASQAGALSDVLKSRNLALQLSLQLSRDYNMNVTVQVSGGDVAESLVKRPEGEIWEEVYTHALLTHLLTLFLTLTACILATLYPPTYFSPNR